MTQFQMKGEGLVQGITRLTFSAHSSPLKNMVVEFITNLVDSSYLGCQMVFKKGLKK